MTEKRAETATPHLREAPEQQKQVEHEEAIGDAGKDGKRVGAGFEKRMAASYAPLHCQDPLNSAFLDGGCCTAPTPSTALRITHLAPGTPSANVRPVNRSFSHHGLLVGPVG
jgi:hypothetical protein